MECLDVTEGSPSAFERSTSVDSFVDARPTSSEDIKEKQKLDQAYMDESNPPSSRSTVKIKKHSSDAFGMNLHINPDETTVLDIVYVITNGNESEAMKLKLMWGAKQMANYSRIREYVNVDGQAIIAVPRVLGGVASKKRMPSLANLKEQPNDHETVKACFQIQAFQDTAWLNSLAFKDLDNYLRAIEANKNHSARVQQTVAKIRKFKQLKDCSNCFKVTMSRTPSHQPHDFKSLVKLFENITRIADFWDEVTNLMT